jgi:hypothetical protein
MSTAVKVSQWDMVITKGGTFRVPLIFKDDAGTLFDWQSLEIIITPRDAAEFSLTSGNGKLTHVSTGNYLILLADSETAGYAWTRGSYRMHAVETNGDENISFTSGDVIVK